MNGKVARTIRAIVYEDFSPKSRTYRNEGRTIICVGKRREYQESKAKFKEARRCLYQ